MNTDTTDSNIPTLTEIIQNGDESMANHFNAHYFDSESDTNTDISIKQVKKFEPFISDELISDDNNSLNASLTKFDEEELKNIIHSIVDDAIQEILPEMEQKLSQQISQQVQQKLFNSNTE